MPWNCRCILGMTDIWHLLFQQNILLKTFTFPFLPRHLNQLLCTTKNGITVISNSNGFVMRIMFCDKETGVRFETIFNHVPLTKSWCNGKY